MLIAPEDVVYQRLASTPGVARYVGFQIFPVAVPNGAEFPFVVYRRANISRESTLGGPLPHARGEPPDRLLGDDAARLPTELADAVRLSLDGYIATIARRLYNT
jgi:hypothetical protein